MTQDAPCADDPSCRTEFDDALFALTGSQDIPRSEQIAVHACRTFNAGWACLAAAKVATPREAADDFNRLGCQGGDTTNCLLMSILLIGENRNSEPSETYQLAMGACYAGMENVCDFALNYVRTDLRAEYEAVCNERTLSVACTMATAAQLNVALKSDSVPEISAALARFVDDCTKGIALSCIHAADLIENDGSLADMDTAQSYRQAACDLGSGYGCTLVEFHLDDSIPVFDPTRAALLERGCDLGYRQACYRWIDKIPDPDPDLFREAYHLDCAVFRDAEACEILIGFEVIYGSFLAPFGTTDLNRTTDAFETLSRLWAE